jgi:hypothetical protein
VIGGLVVVVVHLWHRLRGTQPAH